MGLNEKFFASSQYESLAILDWDAGNSNSYSGTGNTWGDLSGNNNNGTRVGNPPWNSGGYFTFNGSSQYFTTPLTQGTSATFSFACHFKVPDVSGRKFLIGDTDAGGNSKTGRFALEIFNDEFRFIPGNGTTFDVMSSTSANITANSFHHICVTINWTTVKFYYNGTLINTFTMAFSWGNAGERTYTIGTVGDYRAALLFKGDMAVVQLYDIELTQAQVTALQ